WGSRQISGCSHFCQSSSIGRASANRIWMTSPFRTPARGTGGKAGEQNGARSRLRHDGNFAGGGEGGGVPGEAGAEVGKKVGIEGAGGGGGIEEIESVALGASEGAGE